MRRLRIPAKVEPAARAAPEIPAKVEPAARAAPEVPAKVEPAARAARAQAPPMKKRVIRSEQLYRAEPPLVARCELVHKILILRPR